MQKIIDFFNQNKDQIGEFIDSIHVNYDKTLIKFGHIEGDGLSIAFFIHNEPDASITSYEEKIQCLLNTDDELLLKLDDVIDTSKLCDINFSPYLKINNEPEIYGFHMTVNYRK